MDFDELPKLPCMSKHGDGAHCGLTDWYEDIEQGISEALAKGPGYEWTTGWYSSKKEIASARLSCCGGELHFEASVSDDLDTTGYGDCSFPFTDDIEEIRLAIEMAQEEAEASQKDNRVYAGFSVHNAEGMWVETLLLPVGEGHEMESPPGDNYHQWGWQEETDAIPQKVLAELKSWAEEWLAGEADGDSHQVGDWVIKPWHD